MEKLKTFQYETLKILRENAVSYKNISKILKIKETTLRYLAEKNKIKPLTANKISSKDLMKISDQNIQLKGLDRYRAGQISEYLVSAKFMSEGFEVYEPLLANQPADLIVSFQKKFYRIQVKTARYEKNKDAYYASVWQNRGNHKIKYSKDDTDFIIIKCSGIDSFYVFPVDFFKKPQNIQLYPHRFLKQQSRKMMKSETYLNAFNEIKKS